MDKTTRAIRHAITHRFREPQPDGGDVSRAKRTVKTPSGDAAAGRFQVQASFGSALNSLNGFHDDSDSIHKYGLGDSIIIAGILQWKIGFFDYIRAQTSPRYYDLFAGLDNIVFREIGKGISQEKMIEYSFAHETEEGLFQILSPTLALNPEWTFPKLKEFNPTDEYRNKIAYSFDNEEKMQVPEEWLDNWRRINRNVVHVGKMRHNLQRTAHIVQNCDRYEGSLNGMAFLAAAAGKELTIWLPEDESIIANDYLYKVRLRILKRYGAKFKYIGEAVERTGNIETDIDTASL